MNKLFYVFQDWIALALIERGHITHLQREDHKNPGKRVYVFLNSKELKRDFDEIMSK